MKLIKFSFYLVLSLILFNSGIAVKAEGVEGKKGKVLSKTTGTPAATKFNINNISTFFTNDGQSDLSTSGDSGFQFPIGSGKTVFYESGFVYGGYVNGDWRVGGSTYSRGQVPGRIITKGTAAAPLGVAEDPAGAAVRIYRVRRDYKDPAADYSHEIQDEGKTKDAIYTQYNKDWQEWPAIYGAPYEDKNKNGVYEPAIDVPGVPGADQTIWFVCNDVDPTTAQKLYGSLGLGIEMQATIWGYNQQNALGDALFRKYTMINKGYYPVTECYVNMWSDPDLGGDAGDDFAGCDTLLSLGYIYNGDDSDPSYGSYIPSSGFDFMQGPIIPGTATDKAIFKGKYRNGYVNMPMTAFYLFTQSVANWGDPTLANYANGALRFRNLFQGKNATLGTPFVDPLTGKETKFFAPGDPVAGTGWVDGILFPKQDRRMGAVSGPFTLAVGDTQEVVVAQLAAGGVAPIDRLGAVALLKFQDLQVQQVYNNFFNVPNPPAAPIVPLDPVTKLGKATELDQQITITWNDDAAAAAKTENHSELGYKFQGYVVYQLPRLNAQLNEGVAIATFDLIDLVGNISSLVFDPSSNNSTMKFTKFGKNTGIQRFLTVNTDKIRGGIPLANGTEYYFAVSAYSFNPDPEAVPNVLETLSAKILAVPHSPNPGVLINTSVGASLPMTKTGNAGATASAVVVDPTKVTGHDYSINFYNHYYYLASDGTWKTTNFPDKIGKEGADVSPSSLAAVGVYSINGSIDVNFVTTISSAVFSYADGVKVTFPAGVKINSAPAFAAGNGSITPVINGQDVNMGFIDGRATKNGPFAGNDKFTINISNYSLPMTINYTIYDDGYGNAAGTPLKNAVKSVTVSTLANKFITQKEWNLKDETAGKVVLADQTVFNGTDIYSTTPASGPPGSQGYIGASVGTGSNKVVDGLQVQMLTGSFAAPINYQSVSITSTKGTVIKTSTGAQAGAVTLVNYTVFGGTISSWAFDNFGFGTTDLTQLTQDYELRFTGVLDTSVVAGKTLITTKSGGQMASLFSTVGGLSGPYNARPDNPTGANAPYLVRVPFEVWNVTDAAKPVQVNLMFRDREQSPTANPFKSWNDAARIYAVVVNSPYNATKLIDGKSANADNALAAWVWVFYSTYAKTGDKVSIKYAKPIIPGLTKFAFRAPDAVSASADQAKADVDKINVFPNPYYGSNPREVNKYQRFVTFSHLPQKATLRIFNLAGQLVRILQKDSPSQFTTWDLVNDSSFPVASGLYIVHIDMPDLGQTKIVKLAIIQEQQILDHF